jgi:hypothetical protein
MKKALIENSWDVMHAIGGFFVTRAELIAMNISQTMIDKQIADLKRDLQIDRLAPEPERKTAFTPLELELRDPATDKFVVVFEGQHRSAALPAISVAFIR